MPRQTWTWRTKLSPCPGVLRRQMRRRCRRASTLRPTRVQGPRSLMLARPAMPVRPAMSKGPAMSARPATSAMPLQKRRRCRWGPTLVMPAKPAIPAGHAMPVRRATPARPALPARSAMAPRREARRAASWRTCPGSSRGRSRSCCTTASRSRLERPVRQWLCRSNDHSRTTLRRRGETPRRFRIGDFTKPGGFRTKACSTPSCHLLRGHGMSRLPRTSLRLHLQHAWQ